MLHIAGDPANRIHDVGIRGSLRSSSCHTNLFRDDQFCFQGKVEDGHAHEANSPTLWKKKNNNNSCEFSPLLPCDHNYSNLSRLQTIVDARKDLMEMIKDMPESSYELSLKDIVDEQKKHGPLEEDYKEDDNLVIGERSFHFDTEAQFKKQQQKQKKKKMQRMESSGSNKFSRSSSMDSEFFFIKMFFIPSCFCSKKKNITHKNGSSKVSPRNSLKIPEKHEHDLNHKQPRIKRIFSAGENRSWCKIFSGSGSSSSSNSDNISTTSRLAGNFSPGCWPFLRIKKSKARKQSGSM